MKTRCARLSALLFIVFGTAACGQKGPLMLPGDPSSVQTEIPTIPAPGENVEDDDEREHEPRP